VDLGLNGTSLRAFLIVTGVVLALVAARALLRRHHERRDGVLVAVDRSGGPSLSSNRHRLVGRPDALRRLGDGRFVPVEIKHRPTPARGPHASHRMQLAAYCLLVEEETGVPPPYGILRYSDGGEFRLVWDRSARASVLSTRAAIGAPYDGRATPSTAKCRGCPWRDGCDARAA
jgi:CRISPR-associated exonuclease Cas4